MQKKIENFELRIGDIALTKVSKNRVPYIEVAYLENPTIRAVYTYDTCRFVSGNIPSKYIPYVTDKVRRNKRFLGV